MKLLDNDTLSDCKELEPWPESEFLRMFYCSATWVFVLLYFVKYHKILRPFKRQPNKKICFLVSILFFLSALGFDTFKNRVLPESEDTYFLWLYFAMDTIIPLAFLIFSHYKIWMYLKINAMENTQVRARYVKAVKNDDLFDSAILRHGRSYESGVYGY